MSSAMWGAVISEGVAFLFVAVGAALEIKGYPNFGRYCFFTAAILLFPVRGWFAQFGLAARSGVSTSFVFMATVQISACFIGLIGLCFRKFKPATTAGFLICAFSTILQVFSFLYWTHGTTRDFSEPLTHLDAFYFAFGTFTTAGTGDISPISQSARGIQALQMGIDFVLIGFVVVLVMARYTNRLDHPKASPGKLSTLISQAREASSHKNMQSTSPKNMPIGPPADWSDAT